MRKYIILLLYTIYSFNMSTYAAVVDCKEKCKYKCVAPKCKPKIAKNRLNNCTPTKHIINNNEPAEFHPTNNLLSPVGENSNINKDPLLIVGKLLDKKCAPIPDAKIYLWHVGIDGKYPYKPLRKIVNKKLTNLCSCSSFTGSGIATTDSNGIFYFITFKPKNSLLLNFKITHRELGTLYTQLRAPHSKITSEEGKILYGELKHCGCQKLSDIYQTEYITFVMPKVSCFTRY